MTLGATVFGLDQPPSEHRIKDMLLDLALALEAQFPEKYAAGDTRRAFVTCLNARLTYPSDTAKYRLRTIACNAVRLAEGVALEFCLANRFFPAQEGTSPRDAKYEKWRIAASRVEWQEHMDRVRELLLDLELAGRRLRHLPFQQVETRHVRVLYGEGETVFSQGNASRYARSPLVPLASAQVVVFDPHQLFNQTTEGAPLRDAIARAFCLGQDKRPRMYLSQSADAIRDGIIGLVPLDANWTPAPGDELTELLGQLEGEHCRFRVCMASSLRDRYALNNLAFAISRLAGAVPWTTRLQRERRIVALDAGHRVDSGRSQWCSVRMDTAGDSMDLRTTLGGLREDIAPAVAEALCSGLPPHVYEVWRDGKWHRDDRMAIERHLVDPAFVEVVKEPSAVLFRGSLDDPGPPAFGDCVKLDAQHWLLQTIEPHQPSGYSRPLRIRGSVDSDFLDDMLALCKRPIDSLSHSSRLPYPVFVADRASKQSTDGWLRAIGHGWGVSSPFDGE